MVRVCIIGTGFIGNTHAAAYQVSKKLELAAIVDINEEAGEKAAVDWGCRYYNDAQLMLQSEEIDMLDICLPTFLHEDYVLLAAKYKKHVICEKPVTLTLESMDRMIEATEKAGVKFMVAQVVRFWPEYVKIKEFYDKGMFGEIKLVYANRLAQHPNWTNWHSNPSNSGGGLFDLHLHDIDFACYLFGKAMQVYAVGWKSSTGCWDHVAATLQFESGVQAVIEGAYDMTSNYPFTTTFRVVGEAFSAEYLMNAGFNLEDVGAASRSLVTYAVNQEPDIIKLPEEDPYRTELEYFATCIESNEVVAVVTPRDSREVIKTILCIMESLESGEVVQVQTWEGRV